MQQDQIVSTKWSYKVTGIEVTINVSGQIYVRKVIKCICRKRLWPGISVCYLYEC